MRKLKHVMKNIPLKTFISYSHQNAAEKDRLITFLYVMTDAGLISLWHDAEIPVGATWQKEISKHLRDSDILLYLVSADSLASENCRKELEFSLEKKIRIVPIILEDCDWKNHQLSDFQALPEKAKPINEWRVKSLGWQSVVEGLRQVVKEMETFESERQQRTTEPLWLEDPISGYRSIAVDAFQRMVAYVSAAEQRLQLPEPAINEATVQQLQRHLQHRMNETRAFLKIENHYRGEAERFLKTLTIVKRPPLLNTP